MTAGWTSCWFRDRRWKGAAKQESRASVLYRNKGDGTFEDVTSESGLKPRQPGWGMGVTFADFDNDGFTDIYLTCLGPNLLYRNNGDGTFSDVTERRSRRSEVEYFGGVW